MSEIVVNEKTIKKMLETNQFEVDWNKMWFLGLRGGRALYAQDQTKELDKITVVDIDPEYHTYDCSIIQIYNGHIRLFQATTLPGVYWIDNPLNSKGGARLLPGKHKFIRGKHRGRPAFRQYGDMPLLRDTDRNKDFDFEGDDILDIGFFAINLHVGGGEKIGRWSAGCQVIQAAGSNLYNPYNSTSWLTFKTHAYKTPNTIYDYILIPPRWLKKKSKKHSMRLLWGSSGIAVKTLQETLNKNGYVCGYVDGKFGGMTLRALMKFQQAKNLVPDGIVGPLTGQYLIK